MILLSAMMSPDQLVEPNKQILAGLKMLCPGFAIEANVNIGAGGLFTGKTQVLQTKELIKHLGDCL